MNSNKIEKLSSRIFKIITHDDTENEENDKNQEKSCKFSNNSNKSKKSNLQDYVDKQLGVHSQESLLENPDMIDSENDVPTKVIYNYA